MQVPVTNIYRRSNRVIDLTAAILLSHGLLLLRNPTPQSATPLFAPLKVFLLPDSLNRPKSDHRSQ